MVTANEIKCFNRRRRGVVGKSEFRDIIIIEKGKMKVGDKVIFIEQYDIFPHDIIKKGEKGIIKESFSNENGKEVWIELEKYHPDLAVWDNKAQFGQDEREIENYVKVIKED